MASLQSPDQGYPTAMFPDVFSAPLSSSINIGGPHVINTSMQARPAKRARKAPTLDVYAWAPYKDRVLELHNEGHTLKEVARIMKEEKGFEATERQYRTRISQWKKDKNVKTVEMKAVVRKRQFRKLVEPEKLPQRFVVRDRAVTDEQIDRWMKRNGVSGADLYQPDIEMTTPSDIDCHTMTSPDTAVLSPQPTASVIPASLGLQLIYVSQDDPSPASPLLRDLISSPVSSWAGRTPAVDDVDSTDSNMDFDTSFASLTPPQAPQMDLIEPVWRSLLSQDDESGEECVAKYENPLEYVIHTYHPERWCATYEQELLQSLQDHETSVSCSCEECLMTMVNLGQILMNQVRDKTAAAVLKHSIKLSHRRSEPCMRAIKRALNVLGVLYYFQDRYERAELTLRKAVNMKVCSDSKSDQECHLEAMAYLGYVLLCFGMDEQAEFLSLQTLQLCTNTGDHDENYWPEGRIAAVDTLLRLRTYRGRWGEAEAILRSLLPISDNLNEQAWVALLELLHAIVHMYIAQNRETELEKLLKEMISYSTAHHEVTNGNMLRLKQYLAALYQATGRFSDAESLLRPVVNECSSTWGRQHPRTSCASKALALSLGDQCKWEEANRLGEAAVHNLKRVLGLQHHETMEAMGNLGYLYQKQRRSNEAYQWLQNALSGSRRRVFTDHLFLHRSIKSLLEICTAQEKWDEVETLLEVENKLEAWQKVKY